IVTTAALLGVVGASLLPGRPSATADSRSAAGAPARAATNAPTFNREIAPILLQNCASCHRPGEVAPFSLLRYQDAKKRAQQIAVVTDRRLMPPWPAESHGEFLNERRLSDAQIRQIQ